MSAPLAVAEALPDALLAQAQKGDAKALAKIRKTLAERPELWDRMITLAQGVEQRLIAAAVGGPNPLAVERFERELWQQRYALGWTKASALERLCIDRIVLTSIHMLTVERAMAGARDPTWSATLARERLVALAQRRHLAAVKALAVVRRLMRRTPEIAVQVNVGPQPASAAGGGAGPPCQGIDSSLDLAYRR